MRFPLADLLRGQPLHALEAVGAATLLEVRQPRQFILAGGHHDLPAPLVRQSMRPAESIHRLAAGHTIGRLERPRLVVEAGMDHPAVVARLVRGETVLGFQHEHRPAGPGRQRHGGCRADDTAADDGDIK